MRGTTHSGMPERERSVDRLEDLGRSERMMIMVRWIAAPWALLQILAYNSLPYPPGVRNAGLAVVGALVVGNIAIHLLHRKVATIRQARTLALAGLALDVLVVSGIVWIFAFDPGSALWAVLFILPLEGAIRFQLEGALGAWLVTTIIYSIREIWGSGRYDYPLEWNSISFRMGIGLLIAVVAGLMARDLIRQRHLVYQALEELQRVDSMRQGLVSTLAHDVRNPLTVIRGVTGTLLKNGSVMDWATVESLLQSSDRQALRLQRLATDLLDLARLEEGKLHLDLVPTGLRRVVEEALSYADEAAVFDTRVPDDHHVLAEPERLEQVIVNLVANAIRYGAPPFRVSSERDGTSVTLSIEDEGPGVPEDERRHLFQAFRAEADRTSVGFGLAIVKALTEAQGGSVEYVARDKGACFRVRLPAAATS